MTPRQKKVFAKELKRRRQALGLSKVKLSKLSGVARPYLIQLESGQRKNPSMDVLMKLAPVLGVTVSQLIGEEP